MLRYFSAYLKHKWHAPVNSQLCVLPKPFASTVMPSAWLNLPPIHAVRAATKPSSSIIAFRMTNFWALPVTVIGRDCTMRTKRGTL